MGGKLTGKCVCVWGGGGGGGGRGMCTVLDLPQPVYITETILDESCSEEGLYGNHLGALYCYRVYKEHCLNQGAQY